ncbi:MAG: hypothetical protein ACI4EU_01490 [Butyrivibrio sp.]
MNRIKEHKKLFAGILAGVIVLIAVIVLLITKPFKKSAAGQPEETQAFAIESEPEKEPSSETEKASQKETKEKETQKESKTTEADTTTEEDTSAPETVPDVTEASAKSVATEAPTTAPTAAPTAAPTKPVATAAPTAAPTPAPTQAPTQPPETTAPVVHGKDGKILDTLYVHLSNGKLRQLPESQAEMVERTGSETACLRYDYQTYEEDNAFMEDLLGIGTLFRKTTMAQVEEYFGTPYMDVGYDEPTDSYIIVYKYKESDLCVAFNFFGNKTFRMILVGTAKNLELE